jgi:BirA family biotin operon repressor/biotin-[acetyl-CoA-carboxylase] ligase
MSGILPFYRLKLVDSTQLEIKRMLRQQGELKSFTAVLAAHQSQGRGRGVSKWHDSPKSSMLLSIYVKWPKPLKESFEVNQRVCVVLKPLLPQEVLFKWPNDLMIGMKKLGGMLIENHWSGGGIKSSIIGIGINLDRSEDFLSRAAFLNEWDSEKNTPQRFAECIQKQFSAELTRDFHLKELESAYRDVLWGLEAPQRYIVNEHEEDATVESVAKNGRLTLRLASGELQAFDIDEIKWVDPN